MRKLLCPQRKVSALYVKSSGGERRSASVTDEYRVGTRNEGESLEGFDLDTVYCMGCSWSGSPRRLVLR